MVVVVPQAKDPIALVLPSQATETGRAQEEQSPRRDVQPKPASAEDAKKMAAGEQQDGAAQPSQLRQDAIGTRADLGRRLPTGTAVAEELPVGRLFVDLLA